MRLAFVFAGLIVAAVAVPLWRRQVPPNGTYGLRVPATLEDEWVWYEANARAAKGLVAVGLVVAVAAVVLPWVAPMRDDQLVVVLAILFVVSLLGATVWATRMATRLLAERRQTMR